LFAFHGKLNDLVGQGEFFEIGIFVALGFS
jgi:hypothetical protein